MKVTWMRHVKPYYQQEVVTTYILACEFCLLRGRDATYTHTHGRIA